MFTLKMKHHFAAAHQLQNAYSKECNDNKHGHNWIVYVKIQTDRLINNMVVDFKKIKEIINKLDHKDLNTIFSFETTAENLAKYLHDEILIVASAEERQCIVEVEIFEAEDNSITYSI
jgi:6-pyruvoyltetrahydropterin/6-carboxytetrahydropterin synthase